MHIIENARSGRSTCHGCRQKIAKGMPRLGVEVPDEYYDATHWYHLQCATSDRFLELEEALLGTSLDIPDRDALRATIENQKKKLPDRAYPYADSNAKNGWKCPACYYFSWSGSTRVVTTEERSVRGEVLIREVSLHPKCANAYLKNDNLHDEIIKNSTSLSDEDREELKAHLT